MEFEQIINCQSCSENERNAYADDILQTLITFLNSSTCITWIRSHENPARPEGQYGTVSIVQNIREQTKEPVLDNSNLINTHNNNLGCYLVHSQNLITVDLAVYREHGDPNRDQIDYFAGNNAAAAWDILTRLEDLYKFNRVRKALNEQGIAIKDFSLIQWNKELVNGTWENRAEMTIELEVCSTRSILAENINCIELNVCGNSTTKCVGDEC